MATKSKARAALGGVAVLIVGLVGCGSTETATPATPTTTVAPEASPRAEQLAKLGAELADAGFGSALSAFRDSLRALAERGAGDDDWLATQDAARNVVSTGSALYVMAGDAPVGPLVSADVVAFTAAVDAVVAASNPLLLCGAAGECADDIARAIDEGGRADDAAEHFAGLFG